MKKSWCLAIFAVFAFVILSNLASASYYNQNYNSYDSYPLRYGVMYEYKSPLYINVNYPKAPNIYYNAFYDYRSAHSVPLKEYGCYLNNCYPLKYSYIYDNPPQETDWHLALYTNYR